MNRGYNFWEIMRLIRADDLSAAMREIRREYRENEAKLQKKEEKENVPQKPEIVE